jgi:hypothetical protein
MDYRLPISQRSPESIEKKALLILRILKEYQEPKGARLIARQMLNYGISLSERTVRYHLKFMDERGLTKLVGKSDGRIITALGIEELSSARVQDKIGFAISRIENLAFQTTFNPAQKDGLLPVNISFFCLKDFPKAMRIMAPVFTKGYAVSDRVAVASSGESLGNVIVPEGKIGLATVCSIVVNGVLLKNGIPMDSKFAGILQVKDRRPLRFAELIYYSGSSLDPSEAFIRAKMTSVTSTIQTGNGMILANYREIPALCFPLMSEILKKMEKVGINGVFVAGGISEPICQIPVDINKMGVILIGGLNPVACAQESGIDAENLAMTGVMHYNQLLPFKEAGKKYGICNL